jgi:hypothetical protein
MAPADAFAVGTRVREIYPFVMFNAVLWGAIVAPVAEVKPCHDTITCPLKLEPSAL